MNVNNILAGVAVQKLLHITAPQYNLHTYLFVHLN